MLFEMAQVGLDMRAAHVGVRVDVPVEAEGQPAVQVPARTALGSPGVTLSVPGPTATVRADARNRGCVPFLGAAVVAVEIDSLSAQRTVEGIERSPRQAVVAGLRRDVS